MSGERFEWSASQLILTHCIHGLDLRINPRCYLCRPAEQHDERICPSCRKVIEETGGNFLPVGNHWGTDYKHGSCVHGDPCSEFQCPEYGRLQRPASPDPREETTL